MRGRGLVYVGEDGREHYRPEGAGSTKGSSSLPVDRVVVERKVDHAVEEYEP
jgi:hypothetical protein